MPSYRKNNKQAKRPWHALVKRQGVQYSLGYYPTMEEAFDVERQFALTNPPAITQRKKYVPNAH